MKRRFFSICMALALCLGLLPTTALAVDDYTTTTDNGVTTYLINGAGTSYIYCTGDAVIDVTGLDGSAAASAIYIKVKNEDCTITLKGTAGKTYMVDAQFGYDTGDPGHLPKKLFWTIFAPAGKFISTITITKILIRRAPCRSSIRGLQERRRSRAGTRVRGTTLT